jgi:DNA-binding response OmpR family regulator
MWVPHGGHRKDSRGAPQLEEEQLAQRVLLVDDDQTIQALVSGYLRRRGYEVDQACDGIEALASVGRAVPEVVITDLGMPRLDGPGLLRALTQTHPDLPAIVLTAHESLDDVLCAIREGILFDYLIKPPDLPILEMAVRRAAEVRKLRARAREADQVAAMRELAMTAADRILNPCHIISLSLELLEQKGFPADAIARAVPRIKGAVDRITRVVHQMAKVSRYAPCEVTKNLREIDLDHAGAAGPEAADQVPSPSRDLRTPE